MNDELVKAFVEHERKLGRRSLRKLPYLLRPFMKWLTEVGLGFRDINYRKANEFRNYLRGLKDEDGSVHYSGGMIYEVVHTVRRFYGFLQGLGVVYANPFAGLRGLKRERRLPRHIPDEVKMDEFLKCLREFWKEGRLMDRRAVYRVHVLAELMYATGLRVSEAAGLEVGDIDFERLVVRVREGKGGRERTAYLNEYAGKVLKLYLKVRRFVNRGCGERLFGVQDGRVLERGLNRRLKEYGERCGLVRFTSHNFRHALGFHLLRRGCDMRYIQMILGHEALASTAVYTKVERSDLRRELDACHPRVL